VRVQDEPHDEARPRSPDTSGNGTTFYTGELAWTKACIAAGEAAKASGTEAEWCERIRNETRQDAFAALQKELEKAVTPAQVVGEACRRVVQQGAVSAGRRPLVDIVDFITAPPGAAARPGRCRVRSCGETDLRE
jgi:hypothetical protein